MMRKSTMPQPPRDHSDNAIERRDLECLRP
jgi:hypothetical protein